ncbi:hypothetical protein NQZ79_g2359 [Umbelopsis isabellina]|nr:hypothetical protein NQZ79_g2359 [Umbelopsis isabellina]
MTSTPEDQRSADSSISAFSSAIIFNVVTTSASFAAFAILRPRQQRFYAPKTFLHNEKYRAEPLPPGLVSWLRPMFRKTDKELQDQCGMDHYLLMRFIRMCLYLFVTFGVLSLAIICPLNALDQRSLSGLNLLTFVVVIYVLHRESLAFIDLRIQYLQEHAANTHARTLLVRDIPEKMRSEKLLTEWYNMYPGGVEKVVLTRNPETLTKLIKNRTKVLNRLELNEATYLHDVEYQRLPLKQIIKQRSFRRSTFSDEEIKDLERSMTSKTLVNETQIAKKPSFVSHRTVGIESDSASTNAGESIPKMSAKNKRPTMISIGSWNPFMRVDAINTLRELYIGLSEDIEQLQKSMLKETPKGSSAFIVFNSQAGAQVAAQTLITSTPLKFQERISNVAENDVVWKALNIGVEQRMLRGLAGNAIAITLNIFWCMIVAFLTTIATLDNLERLLPFLSPIINWNSTIHGIIEGLVPSAAISFVMSILPMILSYLAMFEGIPLISEIERYVQSKYFMFLMVNVLLVVTIAGTVFTSIGQIIQSPTSIVSLLATSLPTVSNFFVNYLILQAFMGACIELVQITPLIFRMILLRYFTKTPRARFMKCHPRALRYGTAFPQLTLVFAIGMVFATIAPMVITFAVIYYAIFYFVYLHQIQQYYAVNYQTAGLFYWKAMHHTFIGLAILQTTVAGLFLLRSSVISGGVCLFMLGATLFLKWHIQRSYDPLVYNMPMTKIGPKHSIRAQSTRCEFTSGGQMNTGNNNQPSTIQHTYLHPSLISPTPKIWLPDCKGAQSTAEELKAMGLGVVIDQQVIHDEATAGTGVKHRNIDASIGFPETFGAGSGFLVNLMQSH